MARRPATWQEMVEDASATLCREGLNEDLAADVCHRMVVAFQQQDSVLARLRVRMRRQATFLLVVIGLLTGVCGFWWVRYGRVEAKAKAIAYRILIERAATVQKTNVAALNLCLKSLVEWIDEVRAAEWMDPQAKDIRIMNLQSIGEVLMANLQATKQALKHSEEILAHPPERIDEASVLIDPITGRRYVLNNTPGIHIDEGLLKQALTDEGMLAGLMAQARAYSVANRGALPANGKFTIDPMLADATGVGFKAGQNAKH